MKRLSVLLLFVALTISARAGTFIVPGMADPWLANALIDNIGTPEPPDMAPFQSPVDAGPVIPGETLSWAATGRVGHPGDVSDPNGAFLTSRLIGGFNGIPDLTAPICSLIGVWAFPGSGGIPFFMGSSGSAVVPPGVDELFLGTMDGYGWANNIGSFTVATRVGSAPDGGSSMLMLVLSGLGLFGFYRKQIAA